MHNRVNEMDEINWVVELKQQRNIIEEIEIFSDEILVSATIA